VKAEPVAENADAPVTATGVVLAGGASTRFGEAEKAFATLDGRPLVGRAVGAHRAATGRPVVVAGGSDEKCDRLAEAVDHEPTAFVTDVPGYRGPLAGLVAAARATAARAVVVTGCDMPLVAPSALRWLVEVAQRHLGRADAVVPCDDEGRAQPLLGVYDAAFAADPPVEGDAGLRALLDAGETRRVSPAEVPNSVPLARSWTNVNTREELADLRASAGRD
jgi:molybdopterin-guanine dinucleotide biosynthesis protein A